LQAGWAVKHDMPSAPREAGTICMHE